MDYKLTHNEKKRITEKLLGECYHEIEDKGPYASTCSKCSLTFGAIHTSDWDPAGFNRSFNTPKDAHDILVKLVDDWKWKSFADKYFLHHSIDIIKILYIPEKFCWFISEWLKEEYDAGKT